VEYAENIITTFVLFHWHIFYSTIGANYQLMSKLGFKLGIKYRFRLTFRPMSKTKVISEQRFITGKLS